VIPSHEGVECASQAAAVAEAVAGVKGFTAIVEDGAGVARAKRRVVVEAAVSAIDQCDMVRFPLRARGPWADPRARARRLCSSCPPRATAMAC